MVITLIPVPAVVADAQQLMAHQRVTAVDAQILRQIRLHPLRGGTMRIRRRTQVNDGRFGKGALRRYPLPDFPLLFLKAQAEGVCLLQTGDNRLTQQRGVERAAQFNIVGHAPGARQSGEALGHPDPRLRGNQR